MVTDQMKLLEAKFSKLQDSFMNQISDLRQENTDLKAYVKSKFNS